MSLVSPAYLRYLTKFKRDVVNIEHFKHICENIVKHTITSINETFKRCATRGDTKARLSIRLGEVVATQTIVEKAPVDVKTKVTDQMFYYTIELIKDTLSVYNESSVKVNEDRSVEIEIGWGEI
jgi:hypothetical protein